MRKKQVEQGAFIVQAKKCTASSWIGNRSPGIEDRYITIRSRV